MKTKPRYAVVVGTIDLTKALVLDTKKNHHLKQPHGSNVWDTHHAEVACDFFNLYVESENGPTVP